ncbi:translation termination factor eRF1 [Kickxella alabastrina]|uniref:Translation termination factor eRF1 n=1 Tax=Kickxella alabastrina TaxID=61397 RepID=A0ACC1I0T3_9FUNG|nr:translation termination factor eRF1 [Kickxella alabastrina]
MSSLSRRRKKKLIEKFFGKISQNTGKIVYGMDDTLKTLDMGTVEMLITGTQLELVNKEPLVEWIAEVYKQKGALLEFVTDKSPEGLHPISDVTGGMLHWQLDVTQLGSEDNGKENGEEDVEDDSDMYYKKSKEQANDEFDDYF